MKVLQVFISTALIFLCQFIFAQENGTLFLSTEVLKKYAYSYEIDQYRWEQFYPKRFSNSGWKYKPGDDVRWKEPSFSDTGWTIFRTDFSLDSIPPDVWKGIGWFRLKLSVDSSLHNTVLALVMTHYGASEVYLDGKLVNQYGRPDPDPAIEKTSRPLFAQPVMLSFDERPEHLLAVRYSFLNANKLIDKYGGVLWRINDQNGSAGFLIHFENSKKTIELYGESLKRNLMYAMITLSILLLIGSFHLFLYLFHSPDRSNIFMAFFIFILAGHIFTEFLPTYAQIDLEIMIFDNLLNILFGCFWIPAMMLAYYSVFYPKIPRQVWLYFIITPFMGYLWIYHHILGDEFFLWLILIGFLDMIRLFIKSAIKKERYVWIIGIGVLLSQSTLLTFFIPSMPVSYGLLLFYPVYLAVPISMSIVNALRTASTSISLGKQLLEVKRLSELSLIQEQEKQQILASQNEILEQQVSERTAQLKQSLDNLKSTQSQLIQSEKMASLGELTSGIAHEIQNPLNFVNNFSEVNKELIAELKTEVKKGNLDEVNLIADDIESNEEKIIHHGKRADAIVKGMLQHSQTSTGKKELIDINKLADEYLRLSYHGLRAKDKSFNATMQTDFDDTIGKINIIPQDIGRVILNLINNAFYAVAEKKKQQPDGYEPTVLISTKKVGDKVEIKVGDNGNGIPQKVLDKIFQPFFTTKPTGQGTGLGLSLSYDIVKAHGGKLKVETREGDGSEFIILLPV